MLAHSLTSDAAAPPCSLHLVEEINHRVINEYSEAISMLSLAAARAEDESSRKSLTCVAERLRDHAASHRALLPPFAHGRANLAEYLRHICQSFAKASLNERGVGLVLKADDIFLASERCWRIGLIIAELVRNAARHGLKGRSGMILVRIRECGDHIDAMVCEDGVAATCRVPGRGQKLVRALIADLEGSVEWMFTPGGSHARVQIPCAEELRIARSATRDAEQ